VAKFAVRGWPAGAIFDLGDSGAPDAGMPVAERDRGDVANGLHISFAHFE
jgi:hypothetical protein